MSDLKYKTPDELREIIRNCHNRIGTLKSQINNQGERLKWAEKYLYEKTPQEMSIQDIERRLGHKVLLK